LKNNQDYQDNPRRIPRLTTRQIAKRIFEKRKDNIYKMEYLQNVISMYLEECRKALDHGERIQLSGIGTLIPKIKVYDKPYNLPNAYQEDGKNAPYTSINFTRNLKLRDSMNGALIKNIQSGCLGLGEKCMLQKQQITMLKKNGYLDENIDVEYDDAEAYDDTDAEDDDTDIEDEDTEEETD